MTKVRYISLFIFIIAGSLAVARPKDSLNRVDKNGWRQGHWIKKDENNKPVYDGVFANDKPVGKFIYYFPSGKVKSITVFRKTNQAYTRVFNPEGKRILEGKVIGELKDSTWIFYTDSDSLKSIENYSMGKKHGLFLMYYPNGKVLQEQNYKNDLLDGPYKEYYDSGKLKMEFNYVKGLRHGKALFYYPSGQLSVEGMYANDFKEGTWNYFAANGEMDWQVVYKRSTIFKSKRYNGVEEELYPSSITKLRTTYKNGLKNGPFTEYFDAGQIKYETIPEKDGYPQENKQVIVGQKIKRKGNYKNDKLDGTIIYYKLDGTIEKEETYKEGVLKK